MTPANRVVFVDRPNILSDASFARTSWRDQARRCSNASPAHCVARASRDAYDRSGPTMAGWAAGGVILAHNAAAQAQLGEPVAEGSLLRPGDLVLIPGSDGTMAEPGHVGLCIGHGLIVEAPQSGDVAKIVPLSSF